MLKHATDVIRGWMQSDVPIPYDEYLRRCRATLQAPLIEPEQGQREVAQKLYAPMGYKVKRYEHEWMAMIDKVNAICEARLQREIEL